jgi:holo-[acyl-carrier protein] synthase
MSKNSSILGIGTDIIEIERIRKSIYKYGHHFISRIFTLKEQDYCLSYQDPIPHFAARFSAKEAIVKAIGTGFTKHITWQDIEIINYESGKPYVHLSTKLKNTVQNTSVLISISHCKLYATATAIWAKD